VPKKHCNYYKLVLFTRELILWRQLQIAIREAAI